MTACNNFLSSRLSLVSASPTLEMTRKALQLKESGRSIISLAAGEPDFETPDHIKEAAARAMALGQTRYTAVDGTSELKAAVIDKFSRENQLNYVPEQILISAGGKQVISNALFATLNAGDEVIIPAPYWVSYTAIVQLCGATPVLASTKREKGYKLQPEVLESLITPNTKWLLMNSPNNPTGSVYTRDELSALAAVLVRHPHVFIMSDDIYEHIIFDGLKFHSILNVEPSLYDRTLVVNGVSKAYNMTGWRIGYGAGPALLIKAMTKVQSQLTGNACSISQAASVAALMGPQDFIARQVAIFQARRDKLVSALNAIDGLSCDTPSGAFYLFPSCDALMGRRTPDGKLIETDNDLTLYLLDAVGVALMFGSAFGQGACLRLSYAAADDSLDQAVKLMAESIGRLKK